MPAVGLYHVFGGNSPGTYVIDPKSMGWLMQTPGRENASETIKDALGRAPDGALEQILAALDPDPVKIDVDIRGTYLPQDPSDTAQEATYVDLANIGIYEGQSFWMWTTGDWSYGFEFADANDQDTIAVFVDADGNFLEPGEGTTAPEAYTADNFPSGDPTDIPEDFLINALHEIVVPDGAVGMYVTVNDSYWGDNLDPDGDFGVFIDPGLNDTGNIATTFFSIDPTATYLTPHPDDDLATVTPLSIDLASLGLEAGDVFQVTREGDWGWGVGSDESNVDLMLVFTDGFDFIAPGTGTTADPLYTDFNGESPPEDVAEDILLLNSEFLVVPDGATELLVAVPDSYWGDNYDSNNDLGITILSADPVDSIV